MTPSTKPSSNWLALQKSLVQHSHSRKRRKLSHSDSSSTPLSNGTSAFPRNTASPPPKRHDTDNANLHVDLETTKMKNGESIAALRQMVLGKVDYKTSQAAPGRYLALDCEMVGVGIEGNESSLARVSIVNYTGAIVLDVFVQQREKVVDYRTQWSGIRSTDLVGSAEPFKKVQQTVADLIKDRILVGHAVYNDLKALLLSHPSPQLRDTQSLAYKHRIVKSRRPALRVLVKQELDIVIQGGEHSSVTDARATMALFRLYKKQWENGFRSFCATAPPRPKSMDNDDPDSKAIAPAQSSPSTSSVPGRKRKRPESHKSDDDGADGAAGAAGVSTLSPEPRRHSPSPSNIPHTGTMSLESLKRKSRSRRPANPAQRRGISSGISTVTRRVGGIKEVWMNGMRTRDSGEKGGVVRNGSNGGKKTGVVGEKWWKSLGGGKKGSIRL